jgi:hypothetical protein
MLHDTTRGPLSHLIESARIAAATNDRARYVAMHADGRYTVSLAMPPSNVSYIKVRPDGTFSQYEALTAPAHPMPRRRLILTRANA